METDKACHLTLFHVDAQGEVILLLPNSIELDTRASANTPRIVPKQGGREGLNFDVGRPYGTMRLVALATHRPVEVETVDAGTFVHAAVAYLPRGKQTMLTLTDDDGLRRKVTLENAAAGLEPDLGAASQIEVEVRAR
jgi:hypothetical protein